MKHLIKKHLIKNNISQDSLADKINIHTSTIKRLLGSLPGNVSPSTKLKVANYLDSVIEKKNYTLDDNNTKHFSDKSSALFLNILDKLDKNKIVVEPFVGNGSLLEILSEFKSIEMYDILPNIDTAITQDTLKIPPDYTNKLVITNPPYLAKNKAHDKSIFEQYNTDDLYKAFIKTIILGNVDGGAIIIPLNFLTDENSEDIRKLFFSKYHIENLNIFKCQMFDYTKYNTCSFNFFKGSQTNNIDTIIFENIDEIKTISIQLKEIYGYRLFGEFYASIPKSNRVATRYTSVDQIPTNIIVNCIDGTLSTSKIRAAIGKPFIGKITDRTSFTLVILNTTLSSNDELILINKFNEFININRNNFHDLIFTNFRENNRKRIGFDLAYDILAMLIDE